MAKQSFKHALESNYLLVSGLCFTVNVIFKWALNISSYIHSLGSTHSVPRKKRNGNNKARPSRWVSKMRTWHETIWLGATCKLNMWKFCPFGDFLALGRFCLTSVFFICSGTTLSPVNEDKIWNCYFFHLIYTLIQPFHFLNKIWFSNLASISHVLPGCFATSGSIEKYRHKRTYGDCQPPIFDLTMANLLTGTLASFIWLLFQCSPQIAMRNSKKSQWK